MNLIFFVGSLKCANYRERLIRRRRIGGRHVPRVPRAPSAPSPPHATAPLPPQMPAGPGAHNATLLHVLKEEMFAIESEKLSGVLSPADYAEQKQALEIVLKRALQNKA